MEILQDGYRIELDVASQVLGIEAEEERRAPAVNSRLSLFKTDGFVSAAALAQKAKQFDDGLRAAVVLAVQSGAGRLPGKAEFLTALARSLTLTGSPQQPLAVVIAAALIGGSSVDLPPVLEKRARQLLAAFRRRSIRSKPVGFFTWTEALEVIFQQNRMLQTELRGRAGIEGLVRALHGAPELRAAYERFQELAYRLVNPSHYSDLRPLLADLDLETWRAPERGFYFSPPSRTHETDLVKARYQGSTIPSGFSLIEAMIEEIQKGKLVLDPAPDSGWYDYQTWAIEPLIVPRKMPEASRIAFGRRYRQHLIDLCKGILVSIRETHSDAVELPSIFCMGDVVRVIELRIRPRLSLEPLPTHYLRRALTYRFIHEVLGGAFGEETLDSIHRLGLDGPVAKPLADELPMMESLFRGAHAVACRELGMTGGRPPLPGEETARPLLEADRGGGASAFADADARCFEAWAAAMHQDPDVAADARMMIPVFYDAVRRKTKVWLFLGWSSRQVGVHFVKRPQVTCVLDPEGHPLIAEHYRLEWEGSSYVIPYPVTAEVYVDKVLDRQEVRRLCAGCETAREILSKLRGSARRGVGGTIARSRH